MPRKNGIGQTETLNLVSPPRLSGYGLIYTQQGQGMTPKIFGRTYDALKREVTNGRYHPGQRLQARALAEVLKTSTSPVTSAMRQLVGEDILEYSEQDGFIIPRVTERRLHDLFSWSSWLSMRKAPLASDNDGEHEPMIVEATDDILASTEEMLLATAIYSRNSELVRSAMNNNDRLRATRRLEPSLFSDLQSEILALMAKWNERDDAGFRSLLSAYHARRLDAVKHLVVLSYQDRK